MVLAVEMDKKLPSILDAMLMLDSAWDQVSESTIKNCFREAESNDSKDNAINDNNDLFADLEIAIETLNDIHVLILCQRM